MAGIDVQPTPYCIVMTTVSTMEQAAELARGVVEAALGACVQIDTVRSIYRWSGAVQDESECRLTIKTHRARYDALANYLATRHPYQLPEIICIDLGGGSGTYLHWIDEQVGMTL
ncbi:MAG TPA: divalent-cation tolerance protein CutA [Rhodoferax sp.]|jgi:periplasmic divalent cation tolerance protein|nr:divalent-cation tolerance protein CutA [Rhodoferax sp.]